MSETSPDGQRCPATRRDGTPCQAKATASGWCFAHDPAAKANRAKGGRATRKSVRALRMLPERLRPVADILGTALREVYDGTLEPRQASAMAAVAGALVRVIQAGELEERVRQLETAAREGEASA
ncbi:MAG: hypothetical protein IVW57_14260 [Ktedonobacterales bacterium]|nr:hypothetical protein [Ktedonobacterales bacterium]